MISAISSGGKSFREEKRKSETELADLHNFELRRSFGRWTFFLSFPIKFSVRIFRKKSVSLAIPFARLGIGSTWNREQ